MPQTLNAEHTRRHGVFAFTLKWQFSIALQASD